MSYDYRGFTVHRCDFDVWITRRGKYIATAWDEWDAETFIDSLLLKPSVVPDDRKAK